MARPTQDERRNRQVKPTQTAAEGRLNRELVTMTDLFCGAGGSTAGALQVPGIRVDVAVNHWATSIASHAANHPDVDHRQSDISQLPPDALPYTNILWASPPCVSYSQAGSRRPESAVASSRSTAFDVLRIAEHRVDRRHPYDGIVVENVPEFATWRFFPSWTRMLDLLGYDQRVVHLNSAAANIAGPAAPQFRDRLYVVAWRRGARTPRFDHWLSPHALCPSCGTVRATQVYRKPQECWSYRGVRGVSAGRYRFQYDFLCRGCGQVSRPVSPTAGSVLDISLRGARVAGRTRPLSPKTLDRIRAGIRRTTEQPSTFVQGEQAFVMRNNGSTSDGGEHCTSLEEPLRTLTTAGHQSLVTYQPAASVSRALSSARMRFLAVSEIAQAMGFPQGYRLCGTLQDQRTMLGNAVTPPAARDLVGMLYEAITC